jgi:hypothetical protein
MKTISPSDQIPKGIWKLEPSILEVILEVTVQRNTFASKLNASKLRTGPPHSRVLNTRKLSWLIRRADFWLAGSKKKVILGAR